VDDRRADIHLGTLVSLFDAMGRFDMADAFERGTLTYVEYEDAWELDRADAYISLDPVFLGMLDRKAEDYLDQDLRRLFERLPITVVNIYLRAWLAPPDWRERREAARLGDRPSGPHNQGTARSLSSPPREDRLVFDNMHEHRLYQALKRKQAALPSHETLGIMPGCGLRALTNTFWPDFVVTHRKRAGGIEVDGPHHAGRAAADQSRDRLLRDAGLAEMYRIVVEDTNDDATLDGHVEQFLAQLMR
jgi:hypothetical protein